MGTAESLVETIYSAATEPDRWPQALDDVRLAIGAVAVNLIFVDSSAGRPPFMLESGHGSRAGCARPSPG